MIRASFPGRITLLIAPVFGSGFISDTPVTIAATRPVFVLVTGTATGIALIFCADNSSSASTPTSSVSSISVSTGSVKSSAVILSSSDIIGSNSSAISMFEASSVVTSVHSLEKTSSSSGNSSRILSATTFCRLIVLY